MKRRDKESGRREGKEKVRREKWEGKEKGREWKRGAP